MANGEGGVNLYNNVIFPGKQYLTRIYIILQEFHIRPIYGESIKVFDGENDRKWR